MLKRTALLAGALLLTGCCDKEQQRVDALHNRVVESVAPTASNRGRVDISLPSIRLCVQVSGVVANDRFWLADTLPPANGGAINAAGLVKWPTKEQMEKLGWGSYNTDIYQPGSWGDQEICTTYIPLKAKEFLTQ